jgi:short-chain fatty acids transporter
MLPLLRILHLRTRDLVGYSVLQMVIHIPIVFFPCWLFAQYIPFAPPMK